MEDDTIPDSSITASSVFEDYQDICFEGYGRLNQVGGSWCPRRDDRDTAWFQVDLKIQTQVEGVIMQGSYYIPTFNYQDFVTKYKVEYSSQQSSWYYIGGKSLDTAQVSTIHLMRGSFKYFDVLFFLIFYKICVVAVDDRTVVYQEAGAVSYQSHVWQYNIMIMEYSSSIFQNKK